MRKWFVKHVRFSQYYRQSSAIKKIGSNDSKIIHNIWCFVVQRTGRKGIKQFLYEVILFTYLLFKELMIV